MYSSSTGLEHKYSTDDFSRGYAIDRDIPDFTRQSRCHPKLKNSSSGPEVRIINPAIYAESINTEDSEEETTDIRIRVDRTSKIKIIDNGTTNKRFVEANCGDTAATTNALSSLSLKEAFVASPTDFAGDQVSSPETYRCYFPTSNAPSSIDASSARRSEFAGDAVKSVSRVERRCRIGEKTNDDSQGFVANDFLSARQNDQPEVQRYVLNGHRVVHITTGSIASSELSHRVDESALARKNAHEEWLRKKQMYLQQKKEEEEMLEIKKREEEERLARDKEEKERREKENFLKWAERKKKEEADKKAALDKELELERQLKDLEDKAVVAKALCLRQWARKKEEKQKAQQKERQMKNQQIEEERKRRQEESLKAYEEWREKSKNRPKPATQGLLPHQAAKPAFVNPTPWQKLIDDDSDNAEEDGKKAKAKRKIKNKKN
ncbi:hypothetical protein KPH14_008815 [Odynerus spinipes]|uniref:Coiled-coil domain-containing protein n=1 Tax=Odynerus spinipes TaxID=1348599 RepID=A0AAD9R8L5_9HYME|nr:hypothetical protein KPH14_008815 [Odynerus spinipes]